MENNNEIINRENVWHFYAYFASEAYGVIAEIMNVVNNIPEESEPKAMPHNKPVSRHIGYPD